MTPIPDENRIGEMLANSSLQTGNHLEQRLSNAPWTERAVARRRFVSAASFVSLLLVLALAITPQGRALAQSFLGLFIRANSNILPIPVPSIAWVEVTPGVTYPTMTPMPTHTPLVAFYEDCGSFPVMSCTVEQICSRVDFRVEEPANIPTGMYFTGATGGPDAIYLRYEYENNSGGLFVTEERWVGTPDKDRPRVGVNTVVEEVKIGDSAGQYFKGSFVQQAGESEERWESNASIETLRWVDEEVLYTIEYGYTTQGPLGRDGLAAIAESMTTEPVAKTPMPPTPVATATVYVNPDLLSLKIALAERQAGFKLILPPRLPAELASHGGASFNQGTGVVNVWFTLDDASMNGLYLNQQIVSGPDDCVLCNANLQIVQIGDITGKYYTGVRLGSGEWDPMPDMRHLRWQVNGRAFELISLGTDLQKEDLIAIAESMK